MDPLPPPQQQPQQTPGGGMRGGAAPAAGPSSNNRVTLEVTPKEAEALRAMRRNVERTKTAGYLIGGAGAWYIWSRRKPRPSSLQLATVSFFGGLGASFLLMPLGAISIKRLTDSVEDPQHLKRVMAEVVDQKRRGGAPVLRVGPAPEAGSEQAAWGQATGDQPAFDSNGFDSGMNASSSSTPAGPSSSSRGGAAPTRSTSTSTAAFDSPTEPEGSGAVGDNGEPAPTSRWAQLRGERGVEPSKWDKIRQENARNAYNQRQQSSPQQPMQSTEDRFSQQSRQQEQLSQQQRQQEPASGSFGTFANANTDQDPRWSATPPGVGASRRQQGGGDQLDGWGSAEFVQESSDPANGRGFGRQRSYNINSVDEDNNNLRGFEVDSDAPMKVAKGSLLAALAGAVSGSAYGVYKGQSGAGTVLGSRMAFNMFAFGFPFFAIREYAINPALAAIAHESRYEHPTSQHAYLRPRQNPHTRDVASSGLSGAIVGGTLAGWARGRQSIPSGIIMFGLACTTLQFTGNELRWARGQFLLRQAEPRPAAAPMQAGQPVEPLSAPQNNAASPAEISAQTAPPTAAAPSGSGWLDKLKSFSPVRSVSDEEYEAKLKERLSGVDERIAVAEREMAQLDKDEATPVAA